MSGPRATRGWFYWLAVLLCLLVPPAWSDHALVLQTDFGLADGAVASMKGVAFGVAPELKIYDLTHEIPPYDIWAAAYRLRQTVPYWPPGTVFVSVVDPGVGTERRSIALRTRSGHMLVTPDNGTATLIADELGIAEVRQIDEAIHRLVGSERSHTFHGRDIYAYLGAHLAADLITFVQVGPPLSDELTRIPYQRGRLVDGALEGMIPILDVRFGNVWTNIDAGLLAAADVAKGRWLDVKIWFGDQLIYSGEMPYVESFGSVAPGDPLAYVNSLQNLALALNQASFAATYGIASGPEWRIVVNP